MVEWSIAAVLKTVETRVSGGSNPSLCAKIKNGFCPFFILKKDSENARINGGSCEHCPHDSLIYSIYISAMRRFARKRAIYLSAPK